MAITTLAGLRSGLQPLLLLHKSVVSNSGNQAAAITTQWGQGGIIPAGAYDTTLNGVALTGPVTGGVPYTNPASGNAYLAKFSATTLANTSCQCSLILADRLWHNGGIVATTTTAQTITSPTWPARDINGATSGVGVYLALELSAAVTVFPTNSTSVSYTNSSGTSGRTATIAMNNTNATGASKALLFELQAGDIGVQSVQSITLGTSMTAGTVNLVAYRHIASLVIPASGYTSSADAIQLGMPQIYNNSVLYLMLQHQNSSNDGQMTNLAFTLGLSYG